LWGIMYLDLDKFKSFKKDDHWIAL
jgi:hypothetical protein